MLFAIPVIWLTHPKLGDVPNEDDLRRQWADGAVEVLANYVGMRRPYDLSLARIGMSDYSDADARRQLFGDGRVDEVLKQIYSIPLAYRSRPISTQSARDVKDIETDCKQQLKKPREKARKRGPGLSGFEEALLESWEVELQPPFSTMDMCKLAVLRSMIERDALAELKNFDVVKFQGQLSMLEKQYKAEVDWLPREKAKIVGLGFVTWLLPVIAVYVLGVVVAWVYRGFKDTVPSSKATAPSEYDHQSTPLRHTGTSAGLEPTLGTAWLKFWGYVLLPLGGVLGLMAASLSPNPQSHVLTVLFAALQLAVPYGLHHRRLWAWKVNWALVAFHWLGGYTAFFAFFLFYSPDFVETREAVIWSLVWLVFWSVIWLWPNYVYWKTRRTLFR